MTDEFVIETKGLAKSYRGGPGILNGLDLKVRRGSVFGFLGRNGTGKTTAIRIIMGLIRHDGGSVRVFGESSFPMSLSVKQRIGYLSQDQRMFEWMTLERLISFTSPFYPAWDGEYADRLIKRLDLPSRIPIGALSRGEQQKAGLLLALAQRPDLLILDEPAASLDTVIRREFLESVLDLLAREGTTVFVSSQILTDIERIADWIGIISEGKMLVSAPLDDLKESVKRLRISFADDPPDVIDLPGVFKIIRRGREALVTVIDYSADRLHEVKARYRCDVDVQDVDLEELFVEMVGNNEKQMSL